MAPLPLSLIFVWRVSGSVNRRHLQKVGAIVHIRRRVGPEGDILIAVARCQCCEELRLGVVVRDSLDQQYVVCLDCVKRGAQLARGELDRSIDLSGENYGKSEKD